MCDGDRTNVPAFAVPHQICFRGQARGSLFYLKCGRALSFQGVLCAKARIIIGLSEESVEYARARSEGIPIINARFCLHEPRNIDKLFLLPPGKEVLVINKTKLHTEETIRALEDMGIRHIRYVPYYEGCAEDVSGLDTAISPSVFNYGPQHITNRIDIDSGASPSRHARPSLRRWTCPRII